MVATWQDLDGDQVVYETLLLIRGLDLASSQSFRLVLDFEKSKEAISERCDHIWFELMHGNGDTLLLGNDELKEEFRIVHVPKLDHSIFAGRGNHVVLVEFVDVLIWLKL